jgi:uncharacterized protein involved in propanediol utilization
LGSDAQPDHSKTTAVEMGDRTVMGGDDFVADRLGISGVNRNGESRLDTSYPMVGARVYGHHGEILQGVFSDGGRLQPGLLSMPCTLYSTSAWFTPEPRGVITVDPTIKVKAKRAVRETLSALEWPCQGGHLSLVGNIPVSRGFGSSTSDVLASMLAVLQAVGSKLPTTTLASLAVRAETASDPLMFLDQLVLFAHRAGTIIEDFGTRLPALKVVGFSTSNDGSGVDTLSLPMPRYSTYEVGCFQELRVMLREAIASDDPLLLGRVATASTEIKRRHQPNQLLDKAMSVLRKSHSVGLQTAHSGDIAGLMFDANDSYADQAMDESVLLLAEVGMSHTWRFAVGG